MQLIESALICVLRSNQRMPLGISDSIHQTKGHLVNESLNEYFHTPKSILLHL